MKRKERWKQKDFKVHVVHLLTKIVDVLFLSARSAEEAEHKFYNPPDIHARNINKNYKVTSIEECRE